MNGRRSALAVVLLGMVTVVAPSCVVHNARLPALHQLPEAPGTPAAIEAAEMMVEIETTCNMDWDHWTADVTVRGVAGRYRVNRRLKAAFNGGLMRIESVPRTGDGSFAFVVGGQGPATLLINNSQTAVTSGRVTTLLERLIGVPLDQVELGNLLRGCYRMKMLEGIPTSYDTQTMSMPGGRNGRTFFRRTSDDPWRMFALFYPGAGLESAWRLDYFDMHAGFPQRLLVTGVEVKPLSLEIRVSNALIASLPNDLFEIAIPSSAQRVSIEAVELGNLLDAR